MAHEKSRMICPSCGRFMKEDGGMLKCNNCGHAMSTTDAEPGGGSTTRENN